jgi:hypothetical protein
MLAFPGGIASLGRRLTTRLKFPTRKA